MAEICDRSDEAVSALHDSIANKKDRSYYYAHAPRNTGEAAAPPPVHRAIAKEARQMGQVVADIREFQFLDDGDWVKIYLPQDNLSTITSDNIISIFDSSSLCLTVSGLRISPLQFKVSKLQNNIVPDESFTKILKSKIMIKLKKAGDGDNVPTWTSLKG